MKDKNENIKFYYIYFIETHEESRNFNLSFSEGFKDKEQPKIEFINRKLSNDKNNLSFISGVYRFKMTNIKKNFEIVVVLKENNGNQFEQKINKNMIKGNNLHFFLYNFHFHFYTNKKKVKEKLPSPSEYFNLTNEFQYQLYLESIKTKLKDSEQSKAINDLLICTQTLFVGEKAKYDFLFYISMFIECWKTNLIKRHLFCFRVERITGLGLLNKENNERIYKAKEIINLLTKNPEEIIKNFEEKEKLRYISFLYHIIFYFNIFFQSQKINEFLSDDNINEDLFVFILKYSDLLPILNISKDNLNKIVKIADNFKEIKNVLRYNNNSFDILFIINENKEYILEKYEKYIFDTKDKKEKKVKINSIELENYITPRIEDKLMDIEILIKDIIKFQKRKNKFIIFSPSVFKKYLDFANEFNYDNLLILQDIIKFMEEHETGFKLKDLKDYNKIIHNCTLKLITEQKLNYIDILDFIQRDKYYNKKSNLFGADLSVFDGLKLNKIDNNFIMKWQTIKWTEIYKGNEKLFLEKICSLVENITQFPLLFNLLYENKEFVFYKSTFLKLIQNEFIKKCKNETTENLNEHLYIIIDIIKFSNRNNAYVDQFLNNIIKEFKKEFVQNLFLNALTDLTDLTKNAKNIMNNFIENEIMFDNKDNVIQLIKNIGEKKSNFSSKLMKYVIHENEFFIKDETLNFQILKSLIYQKIYPKKDSKNNFLKESFNKIEFIKKRIDEFKISYNEIFIFFENEDNQKIFIQRYALLYLIYIQINDIVFLEDNEIIFLNKSNNDINKFKQININLFVNIHLRVKYLNDEINIIQTILNYFYALNLNKYINEIKELLEMIENLRDQDLFYSELGQRLEFYKNKYFKKAQEIEKLKKSILFNSIFEQNLLNNKNDEETILNESIQKFQVMKNILTDNLDNIDENITKRFINIFRNKTDKDIREEIIKLIEIFKINNFNKDILIDHLILLLKKDNILNLSKSLKTLIEEAGVKREQFYNSIGTVISLSEKSIGKDFTNMCIDILKCLGIDLTDKDNHFSNILLKLNKNKGIVKFLVEKDIDDCRLLQEIANNNDDSLLTAADISDLEKCIEFMNSIGNINQLKEMTDYKFVQKAINLCKNNKSLELYFNNFIDHFGQINDLYKQGFDKSEASKQKIKNICKKSIFILSNKKKDYFEGKYEVEIEKNNENNNLNNEQNNERFKMIEITLKELHELRDRIQITKNISINKNKNDNLEDEQIFIELISDIINIYSLLNEIYIKGYTKEILLQIKVQNYIKTFEFIDENKPNRKKDDEIILVKTDTKADNIEEVKKSNVKLIISVLNTILKELKKCQKIGYRENKLIRYVYGRQFNCLYNYINNKIENKDNKDKENDIMPFLKYITNNEIEYIVDNFYWQKEDDEFKCIINNISKFIERTLNMNKITLKDIYSKTIIKSNFDKEEYKGFYIYSCGKIEKELFQLYKYLTGNIPIAQNILLCNKETSKEEIASFLFRAILCEFHSCFIIGSIESLEFNPKTSLIEYLKQLLYDIEGNMNSCLVILSANKGTDIYKSLDSIKYRKYFDSKIEEEISQYSLNDSDNISIISSDKSGVGKSTKIENDILNNNKNYIYFPLGGEFTRDNIIKRLKSLNLCENSVIHLDLYDTDNIDLMLDFLFNILITKIYKQNEKIISLPKDIEIKIEIPNSFIDFFEKFPILTLIPNKNKHKMSIYNLEPLMVSDNISSNIQIVCNYLKLRKKNKINDVDLYFPGITPEEIKDNQLIIKKKDKSEVFKTIANPEPLSQKECQDLIFEIIKEQNKYPTYYQIKSFIDVLSVQFIKFNQSFILNAFDLYYRPDNLKNIRTFIIDSFIKLTNYFTEGAFTKLINEQTITHNKMFGQYDEGEDIKQGINDLASNKHYIISFDKIDPSLVFFHEGDGQMFSIITNKNPNDDEYKKFLNLKNCQITKKEEKHTKLPNYKEYKQVDFLRELKDILNIDNPVTIEERLKKEKEKREEKQKKKEKKEKEKENKIEEENKNEEKEEIKLLSLEEIANNYVFTPDNFVKMILILIRIRSNVPVIMMGETGCGKTSLIRKLSEMLNNGSCEKMKILNIHAGTNDEEIINNINKYIIEAEKLENEEKKIKAIFKKRNLLYEERKLWVFLDEINTCKSMGLISELMCKHSCQGKKLNNNIVFIAACNPYRQTKDNNKEEIGLKANEAYKDMEKLNEKQKKDLEYKIKYSSSKLVYTVNPLPHSLLNYVFDFGSLNKEDEEKYIENMIQEPIEKIFKNNCKGILPIDKLNELNEIKTVAKNMIIEAQNFIREKNDISSVSLREIRRFVIFYEFFYNYLKNKKEKLLNLIDEKIKKIFPYDKLTEFDFQIYSINLSIFICYYLRLTNKDLRKKLVIKLNKIFKYREFLELPLLEEKFIVDNIELKKGIAKNKALLENVFSLFCCINNKIPIFIVGKPGCSKSLSVQLINKSMKGSSSNNSLFKLLPKIILHSYQGSLGSTSEGVLEIFKKARKTYLRLKNEEIKKNTISTIYFDEMGLAEHSPNNPLKVIHSELEYDQNEDSKKVAFVGISNWVLDASKMNRGIHISIPDLDEEDNKNTALTIAESYDKTLTFNHRQFFENLGKTYFLYKTYLKKNYTDKKQDFHGNRDFYHFVKNAAISILNENNLNNDKLWKIGVDSIERNFAGLEFNELEKYTSVGIVKKNYKTMYPGCDENNNYDVIKRIKENRNDPKSRYLLVISKSSVSSHLLSYVLDDKNYNFFIGSRFKQDLKSEEYQFKIINKIQLFMEQGGTIILKDLDSVYPALYDVFNQNFTVTSNRNYARISIGSTANNYSYVHDNFKCIVDVDIDEIDKQETPFLNRFEKHIITFEYLLEKKDLIEKSKIIYKLLNEDLISFCNKFKIIDYDLTKLLINCNLEEIQGLIYTAIKKGIDNDNLINEVLSKIALTLPQDIIIPLKFINNFEYKNLIFEYYNKGEHRNLIKFLESMEQRKNVIYTFSNDFDFVQYLKEIKSQKQNNEKLELLKIEKLNIVINLNENIKKIKIRGIKSEKDLEKRIDRFLENNNYKICILQFTPNEGGLMNYVKFFIENREKEKKNTTKIFIFIVNMIRIFNHELKDFDLKNEKMKEKINKKILKETMSNLSDYYQIFIDNLNGDNTIDLKNLIESKEDKFLDYCFNLDNELKQNIYNSITYIKYNILSIIDNLNKNNYINEMSKFIVDDKSKNIRTLINNCIKNQLIKEEKIIEKLFEKNEDIKKENSENFGEKLICELDIDFISTINKYLIKFYRDQLNQFYFIAEKSNIFSSLLSFSLQKEHEKSLQKKVIEKIINFYFENFSFKKEEIKINENQGVNIDILLGLKLPGLKNDIENIIKYINEDIINDFKNNELYLSKKEITQQKYINELIRLSKLLGNQIKECEFISKIKFENNELMECLDLFINDYFILFISKDNFLNNNENKNNLIKFLNLISNLINEKSINLYQENENGNENENYYFVIANKINWIENYKNEILLLLRIYLRLDNKIENLCGVTEEQLQKEKSQINNNNINNDFNIKLENISIINEIILFILKQLFKILISNNNILDKNKDSKEGINEIIKYYEEILQDFLSIKNNLNLKIKEINAINEIIEIFKAFYSNEIYDKEKYKEILNELEIESNIYLPNDLYRQFEKIYNYLKKNIGKDKNFAKFMNIILTCENLKIDNEIFRKKLLNIILNENEYISNYIDLINSIINEFIKNKVEIMGDIFELIQNNKEESFELLNKCNQSALEEILINIFENQINIYFNNISRLDNNILNKYFEKYSNNKEEYNIIFGQTFEIFQKAIQYLSENNEDIHNLHLCKLYAIPYIKIYLNKFIYFIINDLKHIGYIKDIIDTIVDINNKKLCRVIKIYILKLFYYYLKSFDNLKKFENFDTIGMTFIYKDFDWDNKIEEQKNIVEDKLLKESEEKYKKDEEKQLEKENEKKEEKEKYEDNKTIENEEK